MRLDDARFAIFDFETTGLYPYTGDRICEVAAIRTSAAGVRPTEKFHALVDPERPISYHAFLVNGITDEMVRNKPTFSRILPDFMKFIKGSVLVAYNAGFDLGFLECALGEEKEALNDRYIIDALGLARRLFPHIGRYNLANVAGHLGIHTSVKHRAMADAIMTLKVFKEELKMLKADGVETIDGIARVGPRRAAKARTVKDYKYKLIEEAIREQKKLNITYKSVWNNKITTRVITPKQIQNGYDKFYIVAHCHLKDEERNFRLDGILEAKPHP